MNVPCCKYTLQRQQGQHCGFQFLILTLNSNKESICFISTAKFSKLWDLSNSSSLSFYELVLSMVMKNPHYFAIRNYFVYFYFFAETKSLLNLNIAMARKRKFCLWIETESSFSNNSVKMDFLSLVSTWQVKTIKGAKIQSRRGDGVNRLVCMLIDKLISHLIAFKRQKRRSQISKSSGISDSWSKSFDLLKNNLTEKNSVKRRF